METTTPTKSLKRKHNGSRPGTPWKTPKKGKPFHIDGYVLLVGQKCTSKSNNEYFDIIVQRAKDEKTRVRIIAMGINKEEFISATTGVKKMIRLQDVCLSDKGFYFYNPING